MGRGIARDYELAMLWHRKAGDQGSAGLHGSLAASDGNSNALE
jgi:TPR repeat protein